MLKYLKNTLIFSLLVGLIMFSVFYVADGSSDAFYLRFTTPKQTALIIGSSRAAQGLQPKYIDSILEIKNLYNYAFTISGSPYGEVYYRSITKKLDTSKAKGPFIVCVNPWTIAKGKWVNENNQNLRETSNFLDKTSFVNLNPNIEYLIESFQERYISVLTNKNKKGNYQTFFLHDDGWLEVTIESEMISKNLRTKNKIKNYKKKLNQFKGVSLYRLMYLEKTITFLQKYGDVFIVRLPVVDSMLEIENELINDFDVEMNNLAIKTGTRYINLIPFNDEYHYTDGNHLDIKSGKKISFFLANQIKN